MIFSELSASVRDRFRERPYRRVRILPDYADQPYISILISKTPKFMLSSKYTFPILLISIIALSSCSDSDSKTQDPNTMIVNTWRLKEFTPAEKFPMSDSIRQEIIKQTIVEYTADKTFKQTGIGRTHTGTYAISDDGQRIIYHHKERDASFVEVIHEFTSKKLVVTDQNGNKMTKVPVKR